MTRQKYVINAKKLDIFPVIALKVPLRQTEMTSALIEAGMAWVQALLLLVAIVPWMKMMFKSLLMKRKKS